MKSCLRRICAMFMSLVLVFSLASCSQPALQQEEGALQVVTSFYPMYILAQNVLDGAQNVTLTNMAGAQQGCLHDYELSVNDMKLLENADVFVINGAGIESFLDNAIQSFPDLEIVSLSDGFDILLSEEEEGHSHDDGHDHSVNGHVWASPLGAIYEAQALCSYMVERDPAQKELYEQNTQAFVTQVEQLYNDMVQAVQGFQDKRIVTFHEGFDYLARDIGLTVAGVMAKEPDQDPSAKELEELINLINEQGIRALFGEAQYSDKIPNLISRETGVPVYTLDLVVSGEENPDKGTYVRVMYENLEILKQALS